MKSRRGRRAGVRRAVAGIVPAALLAGLWIAGCTYPIVAKPDAMRGKIVVVCAGARMREAMGTSQTTYSLGEKPRIWADFKKSIEATSGWRIAAGDPPATRALSICGACEDRAGVAALTAETKSAAALCLEIRASGDPMEVVVATFTRLTLASGETVWQERVESRARASGSEALVGVGEIIETLALANHAKLARRLKAELTSR